MLNQYGILDPSLFSIADNAQQYFVKQRGLGAFNIEVPVLDASGLRPTLSALDSEKYVICIEVRETTILLLIRSFLIAKTVVFLLSYILLSLHRKRMPPSRLMFDEHLRMVLAYSLLRIPVCKLFGMLYAYL